MIHSFEVILRYLLLSDIHSNLEALDACLEAVQGKYDQAVCLGDLVGYGPNPNEVIATVRGLAQVIIRGNHDRACCGLDDAAEFNPYARTATEWTRQALLPENFAFLRSLPAGPLPMDGFLIVHGSPLDEDDYILGPGQALPLLRAPEIQVLCFGHTHYQGGFMLTSRGTFQSVRFADKPDGLTLTLSFDNGGRYLLNPGSVGQPRDSDARAACAILDNQAHTLEYYRVPYEFAQTQAKMQEAGLPEPLIRRLQFGR
jgi:predicted phosphodiesterase